jgi:hypothetical protein
MEVFVTVSCGASQVCTARNISTGTQQPSQYTQERALELAGRKQIFDAPGPGTIVSDTLIQGSYENG